VEFDLVCAPTIRNAINHELIRSLTRPFSAVVDLSISQTNVYSPATPRPKAMTLTAQSHWIASVRAIA
jgi:hypothetical protein